MSPGLTVAVTGPTGTFGAGLVPLLQDDDRIARVIGIARRPFDPAERGWTKMEYRQGDVRDIAALREAFAGADVVVHLAFLITGNASRETTRAINVDGTLNVFRAAAAAGVQRFVYASSVAAYGFGADLPDRIDEDWPTRPAARLFYAQEKAELEALLADEAARHPELALYLLRPPIVLGPHAVGAKDVLPGPLAPLGTAAVRPAAAAAVPGARGRARAPDAVHPRGGRRPRAAAVRRRGGPARAPTTSPATASSRPWTSPASSARCPIPVPAGPGQAAARAVARLPFLPPVAEWVEAASRPVIMDTGKAREQLGWRPRYSEHRGAARHPATTPS